jgi:ABC-2 type transport system permease protein
MSAVLTLTRKELKHYFNSPMAYVIMAVFVLITGWFFASDLFLNNLVSLRSFFAIVPLILLFIVPAFTMRLLSDEKRQGTLELLVTSPLSDIEIILGKFLGGLIFLTTMLGLTLVYPVVLSQLGDLDWGPVIGGYLGLLLMGAALIAIGLFSSSLSANQIIAFILAFFVGFVFYLLGKVADRELHRIRHALQQHRQGRDRHARPAVLLLADFPDAVLHPAKLT